MKNLLVGCQNIFQRYISKYTCVMFLYMVPNVRVALMLSFSLGDQKASFLLVWLHSMVFCKSNSLESPEVLLQLFMVKTMK